MTWFKVPKGAEYAGDISVKVIYRAIRDRSLKAARIGTGRNVLLCKEFVDEWLQAAVPVDRTKEIGR